MFTILLQLARADASQQLPWQPRATCAVPGLQSRSTFNPKYSYKPKWSLKLKLLNLKWTIRNLLNRCNSRLFSVGSRKLVLLYRIWNGTLTKASCLNVQGLDMKGLLIWCGIVDGIDSVFETAIWKLSLCYMILV